jgi:hypothetical protein
MPRASLRPFLGGVAALCLAWLGQRSLRAEAVWDGAALLLAAAVLFVVALGGPRFAPEIPWPFPRQPLPAWRSPRLAWAGMLARL